MDATAQTIYDLIPAGRARHPQARSTTTPRTSRRSTGCSRTSRRARADRRDPRRRTGSERAATLVLVVAACGARRERPRRRRGCADVRGRDRAVDRLTPPARIVTLIGAVGDTIVAQSPVSEPGGWVSTDGGATWAQARNLPTRRTHRRDRPLHRCNRDTRAAGAFIRPDRPETPTPTAGSAAPTRAGMLAGRSRPTTCPAASSIGRAPPPAPREAESPHTDGTRTTLLDGRILGVETLAVQT